MGTIALGLLRPCRASPTSMFLLQVRITLAMVIKLAAKLMATGCPRKCSPWFPKEEQLFSIYCWLEPLASEPCASPLEANWEGTKLPNLISQRWSSGVGESMEPTPDDCVWVG